MELRIASSVHDAPAWRREPYRIFFPLGAALAWAGVLHWLLFALGVSDEYRSIFHSMAQIQGFLACFAVGFLFTMIPRRTGTPPPAPWQMVIGLAAPIGTTVCAWFERWALAQVFWLALLALVIGFALRRFREGDVPPSFVWVIGALALGVLGAVLAGFGAATERMWLHDVGRGLVLQGVMTGLILGVGGFLVPAICRAAPPGRVPRLAHLGLGLLFIASFWIEADAIRPAFALRAAAVGCALIPSARLWLRPTLPGLHRRLVWIAAWMMPIGYAFVAALPEYRRIGLHVVFIGCYALMTLSVSVHVVLSHGGRADLLDGVPRLLVAVAALLALALACRLLVDLDPAHFNLWLGIAAASFLAATVCWARLVLRRPRTAQFPAPPLHPTRLSGDSMRRLWIAFVAVVLASFAVLGWVGTRIYLQAPPIPDRVVSTDGRVVVPSSDIQRGQNVWQAMGGMEVGSVWGHGSYVAPDWSADWLHRESVFILDDWARAQTGSSYESLSAGPRADLEARLAVLMRTNTFAPTSGDLVIDPVRARAFEANAAHYADVFAHGRDDYAIPAGAQPDPAKLRQLAAFFFWTSWAASTNRPGDTVSYTSNWPHEPLVGNRLTSDALVWTGVSILLLLAGIGALAFWHAAQEREPLPDVLPTKDPLLGSAITPSQRATIKYFWLVSALILVQILLGAVTAHYGVEGAAFYGIPLAKVLPYSITRTWHTQLGVLWIATAWLAAGLYIGPAIGGREPRLQRAGVNALFGALLAIVVGSMAGQWLSVMNKLQGEDAWFYFGHSGYEYIDLGRFWQIGLLVGLFFWLFLVARSIWPALRRKDEQRTILTLFLVSTIAIAGFYGAALGYGKHTNLAIAEYWRWWVVHLWVEGFFEVFATVVIAFLFARLGLVRLSTSGRAVVLASTIFLSGGIIGTLHHLYFSGTPTFVLALGSVFSALEVVPLIFVGFEAWGNLKLSRAKPWVENYKWPIYCFVAVAFWNLVGAGLFGFMINPPVALYYMQGLNTTPVHGHAALFGVYGMLGIGLMLFCLRAMRPGEKWREGWIASAFWLINGGLMAMVVLSLLPVGLLQTRASVGIGYWYARSAEFLHSGVMEKLRWMRVFGDTLFAVGAILLVAFVAGLATGHSFRRPASRQEADALAGAPT